MPTLDETLSRLPKRLSEGDRGGFWDYLVSTSTEVNNRRPEAKLSAARLLLRAIDLAKLNDPTGTLALIEFADEKGLGSAKLMALKATCYDRTGRHEEAKAVTLSVVEENGDPEAVLVAANLLVRYSEQEKALNAALGAYEKLGRPLRHSATVLYITQRCAAFKESDEITEQIATAFSKDQLASVNESPRTNLLWSSDPSMNIAVTRLWAKTNLPRDKGTFNGIRPALNGRKLKVGYLSSDFREHPTLRLMMGALRNHDPTKFEVILICSGWDDGSVLRKEAEAFATKVLTVTHLNDVDAAATIKAEGIDVLVELNGPTRANRMSILAYRPAPVQIDYLGWAGSVGGVGVDYVVGDAWTIPNGAEKHYPERIMRMDPTYQINDHLTFDPLPRAQRTDFGIPETGTVFGVFNAINKIQGDVWHLWMRILRDVPDSILWILDPGDAARRRLGRLALEHGVDVKRIIGARLMHQRDHLRRITAADVMLDPWPYGGHTSTTDALYAGVPVITMNGTNYPGRVSAGLLRSAGLPELVCRNPEDYYTKVRSLVITPNLIERYKLALSEVRHTTCFDALNRTRQLEALFTHAYKTWAAGSTRTHLNAPAAKPEQPRLVSDSPIAVTVSSADQGYGSAPSWMRGGGKAPTRECERLEGNKRQVVIVAGSWSSGSSVTAQVAEALGAKLVGAMFNTVDERTKTFEMAEFRKLMLTLADEAAVKRTASRGEAITALRQFDQDFLANEHGPILLKHPLSAFFIPELEEVFDVKIVTVMRPFADIEATRVRRRWRDQFGARGAKAIYSQLNDSLANCKSPTLWFKYQDLIDNPFQEVVKIANFLGFGTDSASLERAISRVRRS